MTNLREDMLARPIWPNVVGGLGGFAIALGAVWLLIEVSCAAFGAFAVGAAALAIAWLRLGQMKQAASCIAVMAACALGLGPFGTLDAARRFMLVFACSLVAFAATHVMARELPFVRVFAAIAAMPAISLVLALCVDTDALPLFRISLVCFSVLGIAIAMASSRGLTVDNA